jgi:hypothetical protein
VVRGDVGEFTVSPNENADTEWKKVNIDTFVESSETAASFDLAPTHMSSNL